MADEAENPRAVIGANNPPFSEVLADEQKEYAARIEKLRVELEAIATIDDEDALEKAMAAVKRCNKAINTVDDDRKARNEEFREKIAEVDKLFRKFGEVPAAHKVRLIGLIDGFNEKREEENRARAAAAAEKAAEEARIRNEAAADAGGVVAEALKIDAEKKEAQASTAARAATDRDPGPVRTSSGTAGKRKTLDARVTDVAKIPFAKIRKHLKLDHIRAAVIEWGRIESKNSEKLPELAGVEFFHNEKTVIR